MASNTPQSQRQARSSLALARVAEYFTDGLCNTSTRAHTHMTLLRGRLSEQAKVRRHCV